MKKTDELMAPMDEIQVEMDVFGKPPVLSNENLADYWKLARSLRFAIKPRTFVERIWLRDVTDLTWESLRLRTFKIKIIELGRIQTIPVVCKLLIDDNSFWGLSDPERQKSYETFVEKNDVLITAEGFVARLPTLECIERMLASVENRRNVVFREIEFHRELVSMRVRKISDEFIAQSENVPLAPLGDETSRESDGTVSQKPSHGHRTED